MLFQSCQNKLATGNMLAGSRLDFYGALKKPRYVTRDYLLHKSKPDAGVSRDQISIPWLLLPMEACNCHPHSSFHAFQNNLHESPGYNPSQTL